MRIPAGLRSALFACGLLGFVPGCQQTAPDASPAAPPGGHHVVGPAPTDCHDALERDWARTLAGSHFHRKDQFGASVRALRSALDRLPDGCRTVVLKGLEEPGFDRPYAGELLFVGLESAVRGREDDRLVRVLAAQCPRYVGFVQVESFLARGDLTSWPRLLARAFASSGDDGNRRTIVAVLAAAFPNVAGAHGFARLATHHGVAWNDDELAAFRRDRARLGAFVGACAAWYEANRDRLTINVNYETSVHDSAGRRDEHLYVVRAEPSRVTREDGHRP